MRAADGDAGRGRRNDAGGFVGAGASSLFIAAGDGGGGGAPRPARSWSAPQMALASRSGSGSCFSKRLAKNWRFGQDRGTASMVSASSSPSSRTRAGQDWGCVRGTPSASVGGQ